MRDLNKRVSKLENIKEEEERVYPSGIGSVYEEINNEKSDLYHLYKPSVDTQAEKRVSS